MAYWGPDGSSLWQSGPLGFGHLALHNTPESVYRSQPITEIGNRLVLTASARLDNRGELGARFKIPASLMAKTPDSDLILMAYEKWEHNCAHHLLGDWSFALWDAHKQELFVMRDHNGFSGLFYFVDERFFVFASSIKGLLSLSEVPRRLNEYRLAQILVVYTEPRAGKSAQLFADIKSLPPAHYLKVSQNNFTIEEYWRLEDTPQTRLGSDEEYVEAFLERYDEAVRCRLRSSHKVGISLSGGLDSSSVLALAGKALEDSNKKMSAFTSVPLFENQKTIYQNRMGDEWSLAHAVVEKFNFVYHQAVYAEEITPLQGLKRFLDLYGQAGHAASNFFWLFAMFEKSQQQSIRVMLMGQRGNVTVSWNGGQYPAMQHFLSGNFYAGWRIIQDWKDANKISWIRTIKRQIVNPWLPYLRHFGSYLPVQGYPWSEYSAINPNFARRLNILKQVQVEKRRLTLSRLDDPEAEHYARYYGVRNSIGAVAQGCGAGYGLEIRDPTIDQRVLEFCFSIPVDQFNRVGEDRWLIRRAMQGLLPQRVLSNTKRGLQSADVAWRVAAHPDEMETTLSRLERSGVVADYLDIPKMRRVWRSIQVSINAENTSQCRNILLRGILAGLFLLRFNGDQNN
jgi:asparagine synthase (glutamine-hydrolysing)